MNLKKKQWEPRFDNEVVRKIKVTPKINNEESKQELESLTGLNKVSQFKKDINKDSSDKDKHPMEQINDIIKQNSETKNNNENKIELTDIEKGDLNKDVKKDIIIKEEDIVFGEDNSKGQKTEEDLQSDFLNDINSIDNK